MNQILVVAGTDRGCNQLQELLQSIQLQAVAQCTTIARARELMSEQSFQLVIINTPLADGYGDQAAALAYEKHADVILMVKEDHVDAVRTRIQNTGILMLPKPLKKSVFQQAVQCFLWHEAHMRQVQEEKEKLSERIQETNLINRAKLLLIQVLRMSEPQAHRYIEKQAMDLRITRREVAEGIINTYES